MRSHEIDYQLRGDDLQFVEIALDPGESVIAEAGGMMYIEEGHRVRDPVGVTGRNPARELGVGSSRPERGHWPASLFS